MKLILYPDLIKGQPHIANIKGEFELQIYILAGQLLFTNSIRSSSVVTISLNLGNYVVNIHSELVDGIVKRIVVN